MKKDCSEVIVYLITAIMLVFFADSLLFGCGYLAGLFLKWICGNVVASGLNMILGNIMQYNFKPTDIPLFFAIMTTFGGFFKSHNMIKSKTEGDGRCG